MEAAVAIWMMMMMRMCGKQKREEATAALHRTRWSRRSHILHGAEGRRRSASSKSSSPPEEKRGCSAQNETGREWIGTREGRGGDQGGGSHYLAVAEA